ncbi:MAG: permease, partial [Thermoanaerobaculia bacterium]|nr:permease [Thermoanaerobaculia bacterium]
RGLVVRTTGDPEALVPAIRRTLLEGAPDMRFLDVRPLADPVQRLMAPWRLGAAMFTTFGALALLLAAVGLYSLLAFDVTQRRRELGIRAALGADRRGLIGLVLGRAIRLITAGLILGAALSLVAGRWLQRLLFSVRADDVWVYGVAISTLLIAGALAVVIPARRATSFPPAIAIREE